MLKDINLGFWQKVFFCLFMALFYTGFSILYNPFDIKGYYNFGNLGFSFHLTMSGCIVFTVLVITRAILGFVEKNFKVSWPYYLAYCLVEIGVISFFIALYVTLFNIGFIYFNVLIDTIKYTFLISLYPYSWNIMLRYIRSKEAVTAESTDPIIKFYDEHKRLKLSLESANLIAICAESNYIKINYAENGRLKSYLLRNSMKSQEQNATSHGMARCHRSFYINPRFISTLSKEKDGTIVARLNSPEPMSIPVSKQYYETLSSLL